MQQFIYFLLLFNSIYFNLQMLIKYFIYLYKNLFNLKGKTKLILFTKFKTLNKSNIDY